VVVDKGMSIEEMRAEADNQTSITLAASLLKTVSSFKGKADG